ncbi:hypothetical protein CFOL_v3_25885 [Cephalotus follicularis]|uniref:Uncharacterized protein n=1 Tax=Cephalotus follicularis TaxID=3775 RepID=A0A1Q3CQS4_CEPFO|nr:hypothetical protein CFOL_v3_25885 [Cephalotus follicularis]
MQDPRMPLSDDISNPKIRKKKISTQQASLIKYNDVKKAQQIQGSTPLKSGQKASKRNLKNVVSPLSQQPERSNSDSLPDSSTSGDEYRALRRKYLLLEEENFELGRELRDAEDKVRTLEDEKLALLDQLVVLEGLIDHPEVQPPRLH